MDEDTILNLQECPPKYDSMQIDELINLLSSLQKKCSPCKRKSKSPSPKKSPKKSVQKRKSPSPKKKSVQKRKTPSPKKKSVQKRKSPSPKKKSVQKRKSPKKTQRGGGYYEEKKNYYLSKINSAKTDSVRERYIEMLNKLSKEKYEAMLIKENNDQLDFLRDLQSAIIKKINTIPDSKEKQELFDKSNQLSKDILSFIELINEQKQSKNTFEKNLLQNKIELILLKYKHGYRIAQFLNSDINYVMNFLTSPELSPAEQTFKGQLLPHKKSNLSQEGGVPAESPHEFFEKMKKRVIRPSPLKKEIKIESPKKLEPQPKEIKKQ
jgi:hypothetical protein